LGWGQKLIFWPSCCSFRFSSQSISPLKIRRLRVQSFSRVSSPSVLQVRTFAVKGCVVRSACFISSHLLLVIGGITLVRVDAPSPSRISRPVKDWVVVPVKGNLHPLRQSRFDQGAAPDSFPPRHLLLSRERSRERQAALRQIIGEIAPHGAFRSRPAGRFDGSTFSGWRVASGSTPALRDLDRSHCDERVLTGGQAGQTETSPARTPSERHSTKLRLPC
jgi:hypothetical protein